MKCLVCVSALSFALLSTACSSGPADTADSPPIPSSSAPSHTVPDAGPDSDLALDAPSAGDEASAAEEAGSADAAVQGADAAFQPHPGCSGTMADCDKDPSHQCETNLFLDVMHCGACGNACPAPATCIEGACKLQCEPLWGDCNGEVSDGCETDLDLEDNCGACGKACPSVPFGSPVCWDKVCYTGCDDARADCDGVYANGCEVHVGHDIKNCGQCGNACSYPHGAATCVEGSCSLTACESGWGDCNGVPADGCETPLGSNPEHCGFCGHDCGDGVACQTGGCAPSASLEAGELRDLAVAGQLAAIATERGVAISYGFGPTFLDPEDFLGANSTAFAVTGDDSGVFWLESKGLLRRTTGSGFQVTDLATGLLYPTDLAVDAKNVYVLANSRLGRIPKSGGAITLIASSLSGVQQIEVDADAIFTVAGTQITRILKAGYASLPLVKAAAPVRSIHSRGGFLYWLADDEIWRIPSGGGSSEHVVGAPGLADFCLGSSDVYFTSGSVVVRFGDKGMQTLASAPEHATHIALANNQLWWVAGNKAYRTPF